MAKKINAIEIRWTKVFEYDINLIILKEAKNFFRNKKMNTTNFFGSKKEVIRNIRNDADDNWIHTAIGLWLP